MRYHLKVLWDRTFCEDLRDRVRGATVVAVAPSLRALVIDVLRAMEGMTRARKHFEGFKARFEEAGLALGKAQEAHQTAFTHLTRYETAVVRFNADGVLAEALPPDSGGGQS